MNVFETGRTEYLKQIEQALEGYLPNRDCMQHEVIDAMAYSLLGGGKRIRGILTLEFCRINGGTIEMALPFACAVEMIHAYSLIHDDLPCMDDDDLRRGKPSCHIAYGEATALLAGDALLTLAFETMANHADRSAIKLANIIEAMLILSKAAGTYGMIGGQVLDIQNDSAIMSLDVLDQMHLMKTGALIRAAAQMGAVIADASTQNQGIVDAYSKAIGIAFQIIDDILDVTSTKEALGKPIHSDAENNKTTYVTVHGMEEAKKIAQQLIETAKHELLKLDSDTAFLALLTEMLANRQN